MTPVQELFDKLWDADKDKFTWNAILKEMLEKEEDLNARIAELEWEVSGLKQEIKYL
tara:strand:- start:41 stop:211 length:171 start_codon:yes stop_codon:yes gene_type:complete